ncbi:MAG TPA: OsmC family protein [Candidatus Eisenbacteria bacterium]
MERTASAVWTGGLKDGQGTISTPSRVLSDTRYSFTDRFESGTGTNPEELVAAAHAGCFSMALSAELGNAGLKPDSIRTTAKLTFEKTDAGFTVTRIHLETRARIPGANEAAFQKAAQAAKAGCPISRLLKAEITMSAMLEAMAQR